MASTIEEIRPLLNTVRSELLSKANIVATGIGYKVTNGRKTDELAILCSVEAKKPLSKLRKKERIAPVINGVSTDVIPTGPLSIFQDRTARFRPAPGGVSIGHFHITAGTLGCLVQKNNTLFILSNNHVLANSNDAFEGDAILQPGPHDGGQAAEDEIAKLSEFVPIRFEENGNGEDSCTTSRWIIAVLNKLAAVGGSKTRFRQHKIATENNRVDCAIARPNSPGEVAAEILEVGNVNNIVAGELGMEIRKSGRTTGLTTGVIEQIDVTARVNFGANKAALFEDQLMAGGMSQGGDSGSVVLDMENNITGLLFAGSSTTTLINRIQNVFDELEVGLPS